MNEFDPMVLEMNSVNGPLIYTECEHGGKIPVKQGTGEILLFVNAIIAGIVTICAGNTVFGGKEATFKVPEDTISVIRLEVGPHLITEKDGAYIEVYSPAVGTVAAIELK